MLVNEDGKHLQENYHILKFHFIYGVIVFCISCLKYRTTSSFFVSRSECLRSFKYVTSAFLDFGSQDQSLTEAVEISINNNRIR